MIRSASPSFWVRSTMPSSRNRLMDPFSPTAGVARPPRPCERRCRPPEGQLPVALVEERLLVQHLHEVQGLERLEGLAHGVAADAQVLHQLRLGGQRRARPELAVEDQLHDRALYPAVP